MTCQACADRGIIRLRYRDESPDEFAVCACDAGQRLRTDRNTSHTVLPLWRIWCAREGITEERVVMVEDVLDDEQLAAISTARPTIDRSSIADAMQTRRPRL